MSDGSFHVEWVGLAGFTAAFKRAPSVIKQEMLFAALEIGKRGADLARGYAPFWRGDAKDKIYSRAEGNVSGVSAIWGSSSEHAYFADQGRGPGKMPPKGVLIGWHGITEANEFVVRRAIGRRGTKGKPFITRSFNEIKGPARRELESALSRALAKIGGGA